MRSVNCCLIFFADDLHKYWDGANVRKFLGLIRSLHFPFICSTLNSYSHANSRTSARSGTLLSRWRFALLLGLSYACNPQVDVLTICTRPIGSGLSAFKRTSWLRIRLPLLMAEILSHSFALCCCAYSWQIFCSLCKIANSRICTHRASKITPTNNPIFLPLEAGFRLASLVSSFGCSLCPVILQAKIRKFSHFSWGYFVRIFRSYWAIRIETPYGLA